MRRKSTLIKKDCILYDRETGDCVGMKCLYCADTRNCTFYKSKKEYNKDGTKKVKEEEKNDGE